MKNAKVKLAVSVEIDVAAWANEFGLTEAQVRDDVKAYFASFCQDQVLALGLGAKR